MSGQVEIHLDNNFNINTGPLRQSDRGRIMECTRNYSNAEPPSSMGFVLERARDGRTYYLEQEICDWLSQLGVSKDQCRLTWCRAAAVITGAVETATLRGSWILSVPDSIALLFKLTWGGV